MADTLEIIIGVILILAYSISAISNGIQLKRVTKEVNNLKVVVKDTKEIREALNKPLEGMWLIAGEFSKYHGVEERHFTTGEISFTWVPAKLQYDVSYVYSARKESMNEDVITCFSKGILQADYNGNIDTDNSLKIDFNINSRTAKEDYGNPLSKHFSLKEGQVIKMGDGRIIELKFVFDNKNTVGVINAKKA